MGDYQVTLHVESAFGAFCFGEEQSGLMPVCVVLYGERCL